MKKLLISLFAIFALTASAFSLGFTTNLSMGNLFGVDAGICFGNKNLCQTVGIQYFGFDYVVTYESTSYSSYSGYSTYEQTVYDYIPNFGAYYQIDYTIPILKGNFGLGIDLGAQLGICYQSIFNLAPIAGVMFSFNDTYNVFAGYKGYFAVGYMKYENTFNVGFTYRPKNRSSAHASGSQGYNGSAGGSTSRIIVPDGIIVAQ